MIGVLKLHTRLKLLAGTLGVVALSALAPIASAAVFIFDVHGTLHNGALLTGTVNIDTAVGVPHPVIALDLALTAGDNRFAAFTANTILNAASFGPVNYIIEAQDPGSGYIKLILPTVSLVGYTGGILCPETNPSVTPCGFASVGFARNGAFSGLASGDLTLRPLQGAVPEPAAWAMMVVGFGGLGAVLRRRRALSATAA